VLAVADQQSVAARPHGTLPDGTLPDGTLPDGTLPDGLLIGGRWVEPLAGGRLSSVNPATGTVLATVAAAGPSDVDRAVAAARKAFDHGSRWRRMTPDRRGRIVHRIGDLIAAHADELALLDCLDNGKPLRAARSGDVPAAAGVFHYMAGWATKTGGAGQPPALGRPDHHLAVVEREPVGVVAAITPWNFPLYLAAAKVAPALAAGCTVILKPAPQTPLSALRLGELAAEAGVPPGVLNILPGGDDVGAALAAHDGVDKVTFTGSTAVGRQVIAAAAGNLKRVGLELGGKSPTIVFADADLATAVPKAAAAIFYNQGECCVAGSRLYVQRPVFDEVVAGVAAEAARLRCGDGRDPATTLGPLISAGHRDRVRGYLESARSAGAVVRGGAVPDRPGFFVEPAILTGVPADHEVVREEVFGPVLVAAPFDDAADALAQANATRYGLAASIFTADLATGHRLARRLRAGTVWLNTWHVLDPALPFGGMGESGWGREMGREGFDAYLESKTVVTDLGSVH
jgi:acyl-CoA reductase-like NAD-dependent aldehyde dehydrogenase